MVDNTKVIAFVNALKDKFENKVANKKTDISGDFSTDTVSYPTVQAVKNYISGLGFLTSHQDISGKENTSNKTSSWNNTTNNTRYPTEKLVKDSLDGKASSSHSHGDISNDGKLGTASGKPLITGTSGKITVGAFGSSSGQFAEGNHTHSNYLTEHQSLENYVQTTDSRLSDARTPTSHTHGNLQNNGQVGSTAQANKNVVTDANGKITTEAKPAIPTKTSDLTNDSGFLTSHQSLESKTVTVEEQVTAESGFAKTYVVKQGGSQVGSKINIPKDFLVKSGQVKSCTTANSPVSGYAVGDKYIDFVINAKDGNATDEHMYILVSDLVEDTTYTADNSTLQLSNGQFSVKNGGITKTKLASAVQTSLGYADNWNSSPAKGITSADINNWNSAGSSNLTISDIDSEIEDYLDAITAALT